MTKATEAQIEAARVAMRCQWTGEMRERLDGQDWATAVADAVVAAGERPTVPVDGDRAERYKAALFDWDQTDRGSAESLTEWRVNAVMAVADAEQEALRAEVQRLSEACLRDWLDSIVSPPGDVQPVLPPLSHNSVTSQLPDDPAELLTGDERLELAEDLARLAGLRQAAEARADALAETLDRVRTLGNEWMTQPDSDGNTFDVHMAEYGRALVEEIEATHAPEPQATPDEPGVEVTPEAASEPVYDVSPGAFIEVWERGRDYWFEQRLADAKHAEQADAAGGE